MLIFYKNAYLIPIYELNVYFTGIYYYYCFFRYIFCKCVLCTYISLNRNQNNVQKLETLEYISFFLQIKNNSVSLIFYTI